jgi:hypothetical protein
VLRLARHERLAHGQKRSFGEPHEQARPNSATNEAASPERKEHREKATLASRIALRRPVRSERAAQEGRQRPAEGERRGHEPDLLVAEVQVLGDERIR